MDDDSRVPDFIEIVPLDNDRNCSESSDVKLSPCCIKVCVCIFVVYMICAFYLIVYNCILLVVTCVMLAVVGIGCFRVFVSIRLSVTSRCCTEMTKCTITQTVPHDSQGTVRFLVLKILAKLKQGHTNGGAKCGCGSLNACVVAENWHLST